MREINKLKVKKRREKKKDIYNFNFFSPNSLLNFLYLLFSKTINHILSIKLKLMQLFRRMKQKYENNLFFFGMMTIKN